MYIITEGEYVMLKFFAIRYGIIVVLVMCGAIAVLISSCEGETPRIEIPSGGPPAVPKEPAESEPTGALTSEREFLALAAKSGCLACHSIRATLVGPAWNDVARRYNDPSFASKIRPSVTKIFLKTKVAQGGGGRWTIEGQGPRMPAYYPRVSKNNISRLVDYIIDELPSQK